MGLLATVTADWTILLTAKLEARGTKVHWATTGQQARDIILGIIANVKEKTFIVKVSDNAKIEDPA